MNILDLVYFVLLFVGLAGLVFYLLILYNLSKKSYRPQNIVLIILPTTIVLIVTSFLAFYNFFSLIQALKASDGLGFLF